MIILGIHLETHDSGVALIRDGEILFAANEEPIVCTPEEAINSFRQRGIDNLAIGKYIVYKN
ncbi:MAG: hypothetical protein HGA61_05190 [Candidatus Moranbacteria bacterium]|nr:hypothetical protein [Candidatus Moranbacteria bacterium]